jgi:hypothetical protein
MQDFERYGLSGGLFLSKKDMSDLLVTALEGGSNYWVDSVEYVPPKGMTYKDLKRAAWDAAPDDDKHLWKDEGRDGSWPLYSLLPYLPPKVAWKIHFKANEGDEQGDLTPKNMRDALSNLGKKYPGSKIIQRIKAEEYDGADADAWLQMAVLDDIVFG